MKIIIQRVKRASVTIEGGETRAIGEGLAILFGAGRNDDANQADRFAEKTAALRIFSDGNGKLNLSARELGLSALVVSNFTLYADTKKGLRPSFDGAAGPELAREAYERYVAALKNSGIADVKTGEFGADMLLSLDNDGPVTIIMDTEEWER